MKKSLIIIGVFSFLVILSDCGQELNQNGSSDTQNTMINKLENCLVWFDGCNSCFVENGKITVCTERWCGPDEYEEAKCNKYKE